MDCRVNSRMESANLFGEPAIVVRKVSPRYSTRTAHNNGILVGFWRGWRLSALLEQAKIRSEIREVAPPSPFSI
jgi:hypothetical protein